MSKKISMPVVNAGVGGVKLYQHSVLFVLSGYPNGTNITAFKVSFVDTSPTPYEWVGGQKNALGDRILGLAPDWVIDPSGWIENGLISKYGEWRYQIVGNYRRTYTLDGSTLKMVVNQAQYGIAIEFNTFSSTSRIERYVIREVE